MSSAARWLLRFSAAAGNATRLVPAAAAMLAQGKTARQVMPVERAQITYIQESFAATVRTQHGTCAMHLRAGHGGGSCHRKPPRRSSMVLERPIPRPHHQQHQQRHLQQTKETLW